MTGTNLLRLTLLLLHPLSTVVEERERVRGQGRRGWSGRDRVVPRVKSQEKTNRTCLVEVEWQGCTVSKGW